MWVYSVRMAREWAVLVDDDATGGGGRGTMLGRWCVEDVGRGVVAVHNGERVDDLGGC